MLLSDVGGLDGLVDAFGSWLDGFGWLLDALLLWPLRVNVLSISTLVNSIWLYIFGIFSAYSLGNEASSLGVPRNICGLNGMVLPWTCNMPRQARKLVIILALLH